ncbi:MAG: ATP-grasp domain-containing protein [Planctomycetaceae bacterium]
MTGQVLLAGASVRSLAESAVAAGLQPICTDFFGDRDLLDLLKCCGGQFLGRLDSFADLPGLLQAVPLAIPLCWAGGLENSPKVLDELHASGRLVSGGSPAAVSAVRQWRNLSRWVAGTGVMFPETVSAGFERSDGAWLLKPERSAGGAAVFRCSGSGNFLSSVEAGGMLRQRYVAGMPISMMFLMRAGRAWLLGTSLQFCGWPSLGAGQREFLWCGNGGPVTLPKELQAMATAAACAIASGAGLCGVCGLDFVLSGGELWLLEVNPRIPASHWIYDCGCRGLSLRLHLGLDLPEPALPRRRGFRMQMVVWYPEHSEAARAMPVPDDLPEGIRLADQPEAMEVMPGAPAFSLLIESCSPEGALQVLREARRSGACGEFWELASHDFASVLQEFQRHL